MGNVKKLFTARDGGGLAVLAAALRGRRAVDAVGGGHIAAPQRSGVPGDLAGRRRRRGLADLGARDAAWRQQTES